MEPIRKFDPLKAPMHYSFKKHQRGVTFLGFVFFVMVAVFGFIFAVQLVPAYMESYSVGQTLNSLKGESRDNLSSEEKIRNLLMRRLGVNEVRGVKSQDISVKYSTGKTVVHVQYEIRGSLFASTDVVTRIDKTVEIAN